jgi:hypothetical protein
VAALVAETLNASPAGAIADGLLLADLLDAVSGGLLAAAGVDPDTARATLAALWGTR